MKSILMKKLEIELKKKVFREDISNIDNYYKYAEYFENCDFGQFKSYFTEEQFKNIVQISMFYNKYDLFFQYFEELQKDKQLLTYALVNINLTTKEIKIFENCIDEKIIEIMVYIYNCIPLKILKTKKLSNIIEKYILKLDFEDLSFDYLSCLLKQVSTEIINQIIKKESILKIIYSNKNPEKINCILQNLNNRLLIYPPVIQEISQLLSKKNIRKKDKIQIFENILSLMVKEKKDKIKAIDSFFTVFANYIDLDIIEIVCLKYNYIPLKYIDKNDIRGKSILLTLNYLRLKEEYIIKIYNKFKCDDQFIAKFEQVCPFYKFLIKEVSNVNFKDTFNKVGFEALNIYFNANKLKEILSYFTKTPNDLQFLKKHKYNFYRPESINYIYDLYPLSLQTKDMDNYFDFICNYQIIVAELSYITEKETEILKKTVALIENNSNIADYYSYFGPLYHTIRKHFNIYEEMALRNQFKFQYINVLLNIESKKLGTTYVPKTLTDLKNYNQELNKWCDKFINLKESLFNIKNAILIKFFKIKYHDLESVLKKYSYGIDYQREEIKEIYSTLLQIYNCHEKKELLELVKYLNVNYTIFKNVEDELNELNFKRYSKAIRINHKLIGGRIFDISNTNFTLLAHVSLIKENLNYSLNQKYRGICYGLITNINLSYFRSLKKDATSIWGLYNIDYNDVLMLRTTDLYSNETLNTDYFYNDSNCKYYPINEFFYHCYLIHNEIVINNKNKNMLLLPQAIISIDKVKISDRFYSWYYDIPILYIDSKIVLNNEEKKLQKEIALFKENLDLELGRKLMLKISTMMQHYNNSNISAKFSISDGLNKILLIMQTIKSNYKSLNKEQLKYLGLKDILVNNKNLMSKLNSEEIIKLKKSLEFIKNI